MIIALHETPMTPHVEVSAARNGTRYAIGLVDKLRFHGGELTVSYGVPPTYEEPDYMSIWPTELTAAALLTTGMRADEAAEVMRTTGKSVSEHATSFCTRLGMPENKGRLSNAAWKMIRTGMLRFSKPIPLPSTIHPTVAHLNACQELFANQLARGEAGRTWLQQNRPQLWRGEQADFFGDELRLRSSAAIVLFAAGVGQLELRAGYELLNTHTGSDVPAGICLPAGTAMLPQDLRFSYDDMGV